LFFATYLDEEVSHKQTKKTGKANCKSKMNEDTQEYGKQAAQEHRNQQQFKELRI